MKIIHCADIHLGSLIRKNLTSEQSKQRRNELLMSFESMIEYAKERQIDAILISGDLFDGSFVTKKVSGIVKNAIANAPEIEFFYLRGNHDIDGTALSGCEELKNLHMFSTEWTTYSLGEVTISGAELDETNIDRLPMSLQLEASNFNIVMLHGQVENYAGNDRAEIIPIPSYKYQNVDYLALGHIHSCKEGTIDARGIYCYPGCLEGRGFDECGKKGFVELEIQNGQLTKEFIPFAKRQLHEIEVDVTQCATNGDVEEILKEVLAEVLPQDLVRLNFCGEVSLDWDVDAEYLAEKYASKFYVFEIKNRTSLKITEESLLYDVSLKGEFLRTCMEELEESERKDIMELGIKALLGEAL